MAGAALAAMIIVGTVGCTAADEPADEPAEEQQQDEGAAAGGATLDPADAVAHAEVTLPGVEGSIGVDLFPLETEGKVQTLNVLLTPDFPELGENEVISIYEMLGETSFSPQLIDKTNLKTYSVIASRQNQSITWSTEVVDTKTTNGETVAVWAVYAAPEDDVESLDVMLHDGWPVFEDIPVIE